MKEIFKNTTNSMIFSSVIACIIGLLLVVYPGLSMETICIVASIYMIIHGIVLIIIGFKSSKYFIPFDGFLPGILSIVCGALLLGRPFVLTTVFAIAVGIWIVLSSINAIKLSLALKGTDVPWLLLLILAIIDIAAGVLVIFNPFAASVSITVFAGIMIMAHSIITIVDMIVLKKDVKDFEKTMNSKLKEIRK